LSERPEKFFSPSLTHRRCLSQDTKPKARESLPRAILKWIFSLCVPSRTSNVHLIYFYLGCNSIFVVF
jgi:hypothetical protein